MIASIFEIGFALSVNGAHAFTHLGWSIAAVFFGFFTLFVLSIALRGIAVGIGYAVWAGIGAIGAAILGPVFFDERLTMARALWLVVIISGIVWLRLADEVPDTT